MRRACVSASLASLTAVRFQSAKRYDLFGYEVDTHTAPWIEKIKACKTYDEAGEVLVDMNVKNCPPDLTTYNATLEKIHSAPSKGPVPVDNESKFCAMMDLLEEMDHRNKIKPNEESWKWVMKECVASGNFRLGYAVERVMKQQFSGAPADLASANENNAAKAKADDKEFPSHLSKQFGLFDIEIK